MAVFPNCPCGSPGHTGVNCGWLQQRIGPVGLAEGARMSELSDESKMLADWFRAIADEIEKRGVEEGSVQTINVAGTAEVTMHGDAFRAYRESRERFFSATWIYGSPVEA